MHTAQIVPVTKNKHTCNQNSQDKRKMNGGNFSFEFGAGVENSALLCNLKNRNIFSNIFLEGGSHLEL